MNDGLSAYAITNNKSKTGDTVLSFIIGINGNINNITVLLNNIEIYTIKNEAYNLSDLTTFKRTIYENKKTLILNQVKLYFLMRKLIPVLFY